MSLQILHTYLLSKPGAVEERPFDPETPVFKVMGKMFALTSPDTLPPRITLKLDPLHGQMVRTTYASVTAGYHMNKKHWNTVALADGLSIDVVKEWIDESYELVVAGLPAAAQLELSRQMR